MDEDKIIPVKVALRIRPLVSKETGEGCQVAVEAVPGEPQVYIQTCDKAFTYDYVFDGDIVQDEVYTKSVKTLVKKLFSGYNVTVLAYGQTGSGKTYTMGTAYCASDDVETEGIIPRSVSDIFQYIQDHQDFEFIVKVSFIELYNEELFDLLSDKPRKEDTIVDIREGTKGIKIPGLTEIPVTTLGETITWLEKASGGRVTAATAMNTRSSRSHALFTLTVSAAPKNDPKNVTEAKFHMVDLAGSERQKKTKATGKRLKEGININMGLLGLGNVISALGEENKGPNHHIPYRDSKLTRLLQDSLGGNSHTLMIACASPADSNLEETISTLRYADRARKIKNKPIVNKDPKAAELGRLRSEVQKLQLQLLQGAGAINVDGCGTGSNTTHLEAENQRLAEENSKLTAALQTSMEDNAHLSEKLLMSEMNGEKLKTKLEELKAEAVQVVDELNKTGNMDQITVVKSLKEKVEAVQQYHKQAEKTILEHDISRFVSPSASPSQSPMASQPGQDESPETDERVDLGGASHALRQTELANQLSELNKVLARKQELAEGMGENHERLLAMRQQYENTLKTMEEEIHRLQKEKDDLNHQQKTSGTGGNVNKVSEMRRKRIQELESQINNLKKKQIEQQRLAKLNEQNEKKVKQLNEDIKTMKVTKVRLIKQMKEDAEKVRVWKVGKEKEVNQLKQKDRKQQVAIAKMRQQNERQQNVMRRKMEESAAINKRLKVALEKKQAVQKQRETTERRLEGAGERVRGWIKSEMEVVVSTKEALQSKEHLITDRKELAAKLQKMKAEMRRTMAQEEMKQTTEKMAELQTDLDLRNAQISELQKQIMMSEQDKEKSAGTDRWTKLTSMVEAKIAAQYLFDTASEYMAVAAGRSAESRDLRLQLEELVQAKDGLEERIGELKAAHEDQVVRLEREHEEKVLFLLRQLPGHLPPAQQQNEDNTTEVTLGKDISQVEQRFKLQAEELEKMSELHDQLMARESEVDRLKQELHDSGAKVAPRRSLGVLPSLAPSPKRGKKRVTMSTTVERYDTAEEYFRDLSDVSNSEESEEESDGDDSDPEWRKTPMFKRLKAERASVTVNEGRRSLAVPKQSAARKRKSSPFDSDTEEKSEPEPLKKRTSASGGCGCKKTGCKTKSCSCKKNGPWCSHICKCDPQKCQHREVPGQDMSRTFDSSSLENSNNKENLSSINESDADNTADLLDNTYNIPVAKTLDFRDSPDMFSNDTPDVAKGTRSPLKSIFKAPGSPMRYDEGSPTPGVRRRLQATATGSESETTPTNRGPCTPSTFFSSPQLK